ncbi:MAG TPA: RNA polymerase sigma factor [Streptosporangiaceae bacterium]|jgi:RNA polymerase sigma-70 factor (ECF subfamily)
MDRSADMALPDAARVGNGGKSVSYRSGRFGKPGAAKPTDDETAGGTARRVPRPAASQEESPEAVPARRAAGTASSAVTDKPDLSAAVEAAQAGDEQAFRLLYRDVQPRLLRYLRAMVGEDAEDVASEAWLHIARDLPGFSGDSDGFRGWAATIARHRAMDHQRRHRRRPQQSGTPIDDLGDMAANDDTAESALDTVSTEAAIAMISELPRDQAEAVMLRVVMGLDAESAGKVLGKRSGAVRTATYRGLKRLASRLERAAEADETGETRRLLARRGHPARGADPPGRERSEE